MCIIKKYKYFQKQSKGWKIDSACRLDLIRSSFVLMRTTGIQRRQPLMATSWELWLCSNLSQISRNFQVLKSKVVGKPVVYCFQPPSKAGLGFHSPCFTKMTIKVIFFATHRDKSRCPSLGGDPCGLYGGLAKLGWAPSPVNLRALWQFVPLSDLVWLLSRWLFPVKFCYLCS